MDEWDAMGHGMKVDLRAADWENVSLRVTVGFLVTAPIPLIFNHFFLGNRHSGGGTGGIQQVRVVASIMTLAFFGLVAFIISAGFRGLSHASATEQSIALPLGGILIGIVDFLMFLALSINMMAIVGTSL
ncbi:MAG: hypothetical protein EXS09_08920 [Gemmataceae bacterium]|nr:hypothetical protein [Gemmataceae bacterium]